jgi:hypothetical protein
MRIVCGEWDPYIGSRCFLSITLKRSLIPVVSEPGILQRGMGRRGVVRRRRGRAGGATVFGPTPPRFYGRKSFKGDE